MNPNLIIMGSKSRPHRAAKAWAAIKENAVESDFVIIISKDQEDLYPEIEGVKREIVPTGAYSNQKLQIVIPKYQDKYFTVFGIDDDCIVKTHGFDKTLAEPLKEKGYGVSYGNDGFQGQNLPTKWMFTMNICKTLGYPTPPDLLHLYVDNYLKRIGEEINSLHYFPDVIMDHEHFLNNKAEMDSTYKETNSQALYDHDKRVFEKYLINNFVIDVAKLWDAFGIK